MRLEDALSSYLLQLQADGRSPHTIGQYQRHVGSFAAWLGDRDLDSITTADVARFMIAPETTRDRSTATLNALRTSLRTFFSYAHAAGMARTNPARMLRLALRSAAPPRGLSDDEVRRLLDALSRGKGSCARRDHLLVAVMLRAGLRIGSALALDVADLDLERRELVVRTAKGDAPERVPIGRELADHLRGYVAGREQGPLFSCADGSRVGKRQAQRRIEGWLRKAGVEHGSCHSLRHSYAMKILTRTQNLMVVQRAMRHRSISSTTVYLRVADADVREAIG